MHIHSATSVLLYHHMLWVCCGFFLRLLFEYCLCLFLCEILTHLLPTLSTLVLTFFSSHPCIPNLQSLTQRHRARKVPA